MLLKERYDGLEDVNKNVKYLQDDLQETKRERKKEKALDRMPWRIHFGRGCEPVVRQTM
jgi:type VI protein secretion system component VasK